MAARLLVIASSLTTLLACGPAAHRGGSFEPMVLSNRAEVRWSSARFPLKVAYVNGGDPLAILDMRWCPQMLEWVTAEFNRVAGRQLFEFASDRTKADVHVVGQHGGSGKTRLVIDRSGLIRAAAVHLGCSGHLAVHELLHVLGFDHNPSRAAHVRRELRRDFALPAFLRGDLRKLFEDGSRGRARRDRVAALGR